MRCAFSFHSLLSVVLSTCDCVLAGLSQTRPVRARSSIDRACSGPTSKRLRALRPEAERQAPPCGHKRALFLRPARARADAKELACQTRELHPKRWTGPGRRHSENPASLTLREI